MDLLFRCGDDLCKKSARLWEALRSNARQAPAENLA